MFKIRALIWLPVLLLACRPIDGAVIVETAVPLDNEFAADSPRNMPDAPPTATSLPPTWTPQPTNSSQLPQTSEGAVTNFTTTGEVGTAVPTYDGPSINYVVQRGDTLAEICIEYNVPIAEVAKINHIADWDHIEVGEILILPTAK